MEDSLTICSRNDLLRGIDLIWDISLRRIGLAGQIISMYDRVSDLYLYGGSN
jgi:hypothetical protein